jgi:hypothetical protein
MRQLLLILGVVTLLLGLLWWPMGVGELGWFRAQVFDNYRAAVGQRWYPEDPVPAKISANFERYISSTRALEAAFLLMTAMIELGAAVRMRRCRETAATAPTIYPSPP